MDQERKDIGLITKELSKSLLEICQKRHPKSLQELISLRHNVSTNIFMNSFSDMLKIIDETTIEDFVGKHTIAMQETLDKKSKFTLKDITTEKSEKNKDFKIILNDIVQHIYDVLDGNDKRDRNSMFNVVLTITGSLTASIIHRTAKKERDYILKETKNKINDCIDECFEKLKEMD
jgi:hypothetical protein